MGSVARSVGGAVGRLFGGGGGGSIGGGGGRPDFTGQYNAANAAMSKLYAPYLEAGKEGLGDLQGMLEAGFNPGDLTEEPGYKFALEQGLGAVQNRAGVQGSPFGGAAMAEMQKYATGLASQTYNDAFSRWQTQVGNLQQLAGLGANAANAQAGNMADLFSGLVGGTSNVYGSDQNVESSRVGRGGSFFGAASNLLGL